MDEDDKDLRLDDEMMDEPTLDDMGDEGDEDRRDHRQKDRDALIG